MANEFAPKGKVFQCQCCGKRSKDLFGFKNIDCGWDKPCVLNATLVPDYKAAGYKSRSKMRRIELQKEKK